VGAHEDRLVKQLAELVAIDEQRGRKGDEGCVGKSLHDARTVASANVSMAKQPEFTSPPSLNFHCQTIL